MADQQFKLLGALTSDAFVQQYEKHPDLKDTLQACTRAQLTPFADGILAQVHRALETIHSAQLEEDEEQQEAANARAAAGNAAAAAAAETAAHALRVAANLASELLRATVAAEAAPLPALRHAVLALHDHALLELGERADVQDAVASLCCGWWRAAAPDRERLLSQALPYLLIRALASGKPAHVRACNDMREGLELLDYDDDDIADLRRLLLHAARSPHFLGRQEGRSFLATVLTLHPLIVREFTQVVRSMAESGRRQVLDAYGDIILRGWRAAQGACLHEIETTLIQDGLALAALRASTPALAASLRHILSHLHAAKRFGATSAGATDALLVRVYEPILFRDLDAANGAVRRNALRLLLDCFPLADPEAADEDGDALMRRQFAALSAALADECPGVRAVAALGTGGVLDRYWEMVPTPTCAVYVGRLATELAFDAASPPVRAAAVQGLAALVDNVRAQPVLRAALPRLAPLSQDPAPAVRSALAALLLRATTSRELRFWDVVPLERLLDALVAEAGGGNGGMVVGGGGGGGGGDNGPDHEQQPQLTEAGALLFRVLAPSYVPPSGTSAEGEAPARVAALLRRHPAAGQTLCRLLAASLEAAGPGGGGGGGNGGRAAAAGGAAGSCGLSVPAPLEAVVALAGALAKHLLSAPPEGWVDPSAPAGGGAGAGGRRTGAGGSPPRKQAKGRGGKAAAASAAAAVSGNKRRKQPAKKADGGEGGEEGEEEEDVVLRAAAAAAPEEEAPAAWAAILGGLAELCSGLGSLALAGEVAGPEDVAGALPAALGDAEAAGKGKKGKGASGSSSGGGGGSGGTNDERGGGPLQRLLAMAPTLGARRAVWRIAAALPWSPAAAALRADALARVASGDLLLGSGSSAAEGAASAAALAALAGPQSGAKLAAILCEAAGASWEPTSFEAPEEDDDEEEEEANDDDGDDEAAAAAAVRCGECAKSKPDSTLLLCDGCDAAYHTACLDPPLAGIPQGDWLCPPCAAEVRRHGGRMGAEGALAHVSLLLAGGGGGGSAGNAGRALLRRSGALRRLLPAAEAAAGDASEQAEGALRRLARAGGGAGKGKGEDEGAAMSQAAAALDGAALWARAGLHSLVAAGAGGGPEGDAEAAVREAASAVLGAAECGASTVRALAAWVQATATGTTTGGAAAAAADEEDDEGEPQPLPQPLPAAKDAAPARGRRRRDAAADAPEPTSTADGNDNSSSSDSASRAAMLASLARWLGLLGDALRLRGFGEPLAPGPAAVVAASGRAALALLRQGARREGGAWRAHREGVGRALAADAALLKLLLAAEATGRRAAAEAAAAAGAALLPAHAAGSAATESAAWASDLLEALAVKPLAPLAPTLTREVNAVVGLLLEDEQARQQQQQRQAAAGGADDDDEGGDDGDNGAPASWVRALASAAAAALLAAVEKQRGSDEDAAEDGENADPAATAASAPGGAGGKGAAAAVPSAPRAVALPTVVVAALAAGAGAGPGARRGPGHGALAHAAAEAALDAGRREDWSLMAGALRLAAAANGSVAAASAALADLCGDELRSLRAEAVVAAGGGGAGGKAGAASALMAAAEVDLLIVPAVADAAAVAVAAI